MHSKTESDVTSIDASSPNRSPRRPAYYVQSPCRDSHDGEKTTTTSFHSTPVLSPAASPRHSHSSIGHHSRESSSSRFSGSRKISPNEVGRSGHGKVEKQRKECAMIEEEGLLDDETSGRSTTRRRYYALAFIVGFVVLFTMFSLILLGASRPQKPKITMKSITFDTLTVQSGTDSTNVATDMITMNATLKMIYRNTGTFFGVHVLPTPIDLSFSQIKIASGTMMKFYQSRSSQRLVSVNVMSEKIPLYGSGASLSSSTAPITNTTPPAAPVPLKLSFTVKTRAYVLGKLVKPKFYKKIDCDFNFEHKKMNKPISLKNNCTYN